MMTEKLRGRPHYEIGTAQKRLFYFIQYLIRQDSYSIYRTDSESRKKLEGAIVLERIGPIELNFEKK